MTHKSGWLFRSRTWLRDVTAKRRKSYIDWTWGVLSNPGVELGWELTSLPGQGVTGGHNFSPRETWLPTFNSAAGLENHFHLDDAGLVRVFLAVVWYAVRSFLSSTFKDFYLFLREICPAWCSVYLPADLGMVAYGWLSLSLLIWCLVQLTSSKICHFSHFLENKADERNQDDMLMC